jgi:hypothetical protein
MKKCTKTNVKKKRNALWITIVIHSEVNSNQLNIKKLKSKKIILKKNITKKENTKETGKKPCEEKLYQSIVFCEEKHIFTCNCNS